MENADWERCKTKFNTQWKGQFKLQRRMLRGAIEPPARNDVENVWFFCSGALRKNIHCCQAGVFHHCEGGLTAAKGRVSPRPPLQFLLQPGVRFSLLPRVGFSLQPGVCSLRTQWRSCSRLPRPSQIARRSHFG